MFRHDGVTQTSGVVIDEDNEVEIVFGSAIMQGPVTVACFPLCFSCSSAVCWCVCLGESERESHRDFRFRIHFSDMVAGWRPTQEDALSFLSGSYPGTNATIAIFSVFDGHGGTR
jgi:hypothetical protein